jgi:hypothetical protein
MTELTTNVTGLTTGGTPPVPPENRHPYASWSVERLATQLGGRHIAVYPNGEPELAVPFTVGQPIGDLDTQQFTVLVWEDASVDVARGVDNDTANAAWLALYEGVKARFRIQANISLGEPGAQTRYISGAFDLKGESRVIEIRFTVQIGRNFT